MYRPAYSRWENQAEMFELIHQFPLATLILPTGPDVPFEIQHLPLHTPENSADSPHLIGHMARANPLAKKLACSQRALCLFHGPQGYISPQWYKTSPQVPTWNYSVVHIEGMLSLIEEPQQLKKILHQQVKREEARLPSPWEYKLPEKFEADLIQAIVGLRLDIQSIEGKQKMSQNRSLEDWSSAVSKSTQHYQSSRPEFGKMMEQIFSSSAKTGRE